MKGALNNTRYLKQLNGRRYIEWMPFDTLMYWSMQPLYIDLKIMPVRTRWSVNDFVLYNVY